MRWKNHDRGRGVQFKNFAPLDQLSTQKYVQLQNWRVNAAVIYSHFLGPRHELHVGQMEKKMLFWEVWERR